MEQLPGNGEASWLPAWRGAAGNCLRVVVCRTDALSLTVKEADGSGPELRLALSAGNGTVPTDRDLTGMRLNIVNPRICGAEADGDIVVLDPDCLIDVSAVAACFEPYGESAARYLLNTLKPPPGSPAVLLGNLASQFLDEEVNGLSLTGDYATSIRKFFGRNGLALAACKGLGRDFHTQARQQRENIARTVRHNLKQKTDARSTFVVEPSFVCEMLGLQGRMDMMSADMRVLVEQKSGKAAYTRRAESLMPQVKHEVQLLLYMAVLHYGFEIGYDEFEAYLLYSKYPNGLVAGRSSQALLSRAFKLRNEIVLALRQCAGPDAWQALGSITPQSLVTDDRGKDFMARFGRAEVVGLTTPLHEVTELERAYFLRMYQFLATEHLLSKTVGQGIERLGFASVWLSTVEEKRATGEIINGLRLARTVEDGTGGVTHLVLVNDGSASCGESNFRMGDVVIAYPDKGNGLAGVGAAFVFRASVESIDSGGITLRLRSPQGSSVSFSLPEGWAWAVEHDFIESSFAYNCRALHQFLSATRRRRELILCQRPPIADLSLHAPRANCSGDICELRRRAWQAREMFIIQGPPGTGKTSLGMAGIVADQLTVPGSTVLLVACTNRAVDEMCSKLLGIGEGEGTDFIRLGNSLSCSEEFRPYLLCERLAQLGTLSAVRQLIARTRVVAATVATLNAMPHLFELKRFDLAIIDEASQIPEPHLLGLLSARHRGGDAVGKFIMIGDERQLPAVVAQDTAQSSVDDPPLRAIGLRDCRLSLFERLLSFYGGDPQVTFMLSKQGRMHAEIAEFPAAEFYGGRLEIVPLPHQTAPAPLAPAGSSKLLRLVAECRFAFIALYNQPDADCDGKVNHAEAKLIAAIVKAARDAALSFDASTSVGVIVPYRSQASAVRTAIEQLCPGLGDVTVDTVERYQGSQRDTIIFGTTVSGQRQLESLSSLAITSTGETVDRKLNVALTRAREHLFVIGDPRVLCASPVYARLMEHARRKGNFVEVALENMDTE